MSRIIFSMIISDRIKLIDILFEVRELHDVNLFENFVV
jgi:hypothetical protein